jgi:hypothetical protein
MRRIPTPRDNRVAPSSLEVETSDPVCARAGTVIAIVITSIAANSINFFNVSPFPVRVPLTRGGPPKGPAYTLG